MSSYSLSADDVLFDGFWSGVKKVAAKSPIVSAVKFVAHPIKESKAALKTIARFDPTSKTAKYGNFTKGVLTGTALGVAAVLTGGGALAVGAGAASAAATARKISITPVRKPVKGITPPVVTGVPSINTVTEAPLNTLMAPRSSAPLTNQPASYTSSSKPDNSKLYIIGGGAVVALIVFVLASKGA